MEKINLHLLFVFWQKLVSTVVFLRSVFIFFLWVYEDFGNGGLLLGPVHKLRRHWGGRGPLSWILAKVYGTHKFRNFCMDKSLGGREVSGCQNWIYVVYEQHTSDWIPLKKRRSFILLNELILPITPHWPCHRLLLSPTQQQLLPKTDPERFYMYFWTTTTTSHPSSASGVMVMLLLFFFYLFADVATYLSRSERACLHWTGV